MTKLRVGGRQRNDYVALREQNLKGLMTAEITESRYYRDFCWPLSADRELSDTLSDLRKSPQNTCVCERIRHAKM
ncbi:MAG TPA: hypothetical protein DCS07_08160 [Bdellovibrionales bacterium]|nr:hypothetical protein [Bdellovibrionales bacterium]HCM41683.1 hypothetical protein [Bdellovibrionales bacterium]